MRTPRAPTSEQNRIKMSFIGTLIAVAFCVGNLLFVSSTCYELISFLSQQKKHPFQDSVNGSVLPAVLTDGWILIIFIAQHSFMKFPSVLSLIKKVGLEVWQRTIYVIATCLVLQILMKFWMEIGTFKLWEVNTTDNLYWWLFAIVHTLCWIVIYGGCLIMDLAEIIGIKQVYYNIQGLQNPCLYKSRDLLRLYSHCRHPSISAFAVILWFYPVMGLGRLLLAIILSLYMILAFKTDAIDYNYQKVQIKQKKYELQYSYTS